MTSGVENLRSLRMLCKALWQVFCFGRDVCFFAFDQMILPGHFLRKLTDEGKVVWYLFLNWCFFKGLDPMGFVAIKNHHDWCLGHFFAGQSNKQIQVVEQRNPTHKCPWMEFRPKYDDSKFNHIWGQSWCYFQTCLYVFKHRAFKRKSFPSWKLFVCF